MGVPQQRQTNKPMDVPQCSYEKWLITGSAVYINGDGETSRDFRPGDVRHSLADISKARQFIGYESQFSVTQGLDMAAAWYMERRL